MPSTKHITIAIIGPTQATKLNNKHFMSFMCCSKILAKITELLWIDLCLESLTSGGNTQVFMWGCNCWWPWQCHPSYHYAVVSHDARDEYNLRWGIQCTRKPKVWLGNIINCHFTQKKQGMPNCLFHQTIIFNIFVVQLWKSTKM